VKKDASFSSVPRHIAVIMENGLQNSALGIFVALTLLNNEAMMAPSIIYAFAMNLTAIMVIVYLKRSVWLEQIGRNLSH